jgi:hypothetical protein
MGGIIAAQNTGVFNNSILPEQAREYIDAGEKPHLSLLCRRELLTFVVQGAVVVDSNVDLAAVDISGVYGRNNEIDVTGGEVKFEIKDKKLHVTGFNALKMSER